MFYVKFFLKFLGCMHLLTLTVFEWLISMKCYRGNAGHPINLIIPCSLQLAAGFFIAKRFRADKRPQVPHHPDMEHYRQKLSTPSSALLLMLNNSPHGRPYSQPAT